MYVKGVTVAARRDGNHRSRSYQYFIDQAVFLFFSQSQWYAVIEAFTGNLKGDFIRHHINHPQNALNLEGNAYNSMDSYHLAAAEVSDACGASVNFDEFVDDNDDESVVPVILEAHISQMMRGWPNLKIAGSTLQLIRALSHPPPLFCYPIP